MDINASQHIWNFLERFSLTGLADTDEAQLESSAWQVFPNPSAGTVHVITQLHRLLAVDVVDVQGRILDVPFRGISPQETELDVSGLPNGVYLLRSGSVMQRLVVMH
jgi:hypothetical protein